MPIRYKILTPERNSFYAEGDYRLKYSKGATVKAIPRTVGIMVFDNLENAKTFRGSKYNYSPIVKVKPIGRGKKQPNICACVSELMINEFYNFNIQGDPSPKGTICYPAVEVLE